MTIKDTLHDVVSSISHSGSGLSIAQIAEDFHMPHFTSPSLSNPCGLAPCEITGLASATTSLKDVLSTPEAAQAFGRTAGTLVAMNLSKPSWAKAGVGVGASAIDVLLDQTVFSNVKQGAPSIFCDYLGIAAAATRQPLPLVFAEMVGLHAIGKLIEKSNK